MEISKKICVIWVITFQGFLLLLITYFGLLQGIHDHKIRSAWSEFANESVEVMGETDFNEDLSWLSFTTRNITRLVSQERQHKPVKKADVPRAPGKTLLFPNIKHNPGEIFMFVFVTTMPKSVGKREVIRNTWGSVEKYYKTIPNSLNSSTVTNATNAVVYIVFMLGQTGNIKVDMDIENEAEKHGDILRGDHVETYRNIVIKVFYAYNWALLYKPRFVLKVDDDMYVHIPRFVTWLLNPDRPKKLYAGYVHFNAYIARNPRNPHYVSKKEFPERRYPKYCAGPCYVFSGNLLKTFIQQTHEIPVFRVEDAFLGVVARRSKVRALDIGGKLYVWNRALKRWIRNWPSSKLRKGLCYGDNLDTGTIQYMYNRFQKVENPSSVVKVSKQQVTAVPGN